MQPGFVRIIAGKWRGRRLKIPNEPGLRPTPDRVRETVFNWLAPHLLGARCLDLFAGSGALGFEALSRGAGWVVMVEVSKTIVTLLKEELSQFEANNAEILLGSSPQVLDQLQLDPFDIVFLDPPYQLEVLLPTCFALEEKNFLAPTALIYLEAKQLIKDNELPKNWRIIKAQRAGQVYFHLARREDNENQ